MKTSLKWLIATYSWSGVALILGICHVSYTKYGKYWWIIAVVFLTGLIVSINKESNSL